MGHFSPPNEIIQFLGNPPPPQPATSLQYHSHCTVPMIQKQKEKYIMIYNAYYYDYPYLSAKGMKAARRPLISIWPPREDEDCRPLLECGHRSRDSIGTNRVSSRIFYGMISVSLPFQLSSCKEQVSKHREYQVSAFNMLVCKQKKVKHSHKSP